MKPMTTYEELTPEEAHRRRAEFHAVDVRAPHEVAGPLGHVEGVLVIPLPELRARAEELPADLPLLMVCRSGGRSGMACDQLHELGLGPALNLAGGMIAWNRAQLPTVTTDPESLHELVEGVARWLTQVGPQSEEEIQEILRERCGRTGASLDEPTHAVVDAILDDLESAFFATGGPADLDLSLTAFRRALAVL
jgi:rhodanese-related sulfurtransferase